MDPRTALAPYFVRFRAMHPEAQVYGPIFIEPGQFDARAHVLIDDQELRAAVEASWQPVGSEGPGCNPTPDSLLVIATLA